MKLPLSSSLETESNVRSAAISQRAYWIYRQVLKDSIISGCHSCLKTIFGNTISCSTNKTKTSFIRPKASCEVFQVRSPLPSYGGGSGDFAAQLSQLLPLAIAETINAQRLSTARANKGWALKLQESSGKKSGGLLLSADPAAPTDLWIAAQDLTYYLRFDRKVHATIGDDRVALKSKTSLKITDKFANHKRLRDPATRDAQMDTAHASLPSELQIALKQQGVGPGFSKALTSLLYLLAQDMFLVAPATKVVLPWPVPKILDNLRKVAGPAMQQIETLSAQPVPDVFHVLAARWQNVEDRLYESEFGSAPIPQRNSSGENLFDHSVALSYAYNLINS